MPRRFFRKFTIKRHEVGKTWFLAPFKNLIQEPRLWGIRRRTVVPAFALGLFIAFLPFPGHTLFAIFAALALRVNVPIAAVTTFVVNPLTMGPIYFAEYELGRRLLDAPQETFAFEMSFEWVTQTFVKFWQPMTLGALLLGSAAAFIGFVVVDALWRFSLHDYKSRKRRERRDNESN